jgi:hypothetical protein
MEEKFGLSGVREVRLEILGHEQFGWCAPDIRAYSGKSIKLLIQKGVLSFDLDKLSFTSIV